MSSRPEIPQPMKRRIRKRCGFGCVVCGTPIVEYHHIKGFDESIGHVEPEITLLCPTCHRKHHNGLIPADEVARCSLTPRNWQTGTSQPETVWYATGPVSIGLGTNLIHGLPNNRSTVVLMCDGQPLIGVERQDGVSLLSLRMVDPFHQPLVLIDRNELSFAVTDDFDIEYTAGTLTLRIQNLIAFQADFQPPRLAIRRGVFFWNGIWVDCDAKALYVNGQPALSNCESAYCDVGISIGRDPNNQGAGIRVAAKTRLVPDLEAKDWRQIPESDMFGES